MVTNCPTRCSFSEKKECSCFAYGRVSRATSSAPCLWSVFHGFSISSPLHRDFVARTSRFTRLRKKCKLREHGPIFTQTTAKRQTKSRKRTRNLTKRLLDAVIIKIGWCISRRRFARTSGWTYEREPVHPEEERHDIPRGNLDFKNKKQNNSSKPGNTWDHLWEQSRVVLNIMAAPKCLRLLTKIQITRRGQKMMQEAACQWAKSFTEFAELTRRTKLHSSQQRWSGE